MLHAALHEKIVAAIKARADQQQHPDGTSYQGIDLRSIANLAGRFGLTKRQVELCALENGVLPIRYARNGQSLTYSDQIALLQACVGVVGLGGLGGSVCETLARVGVGQLRLFDADTFAEHNLNRQLFCTEKHLGISKALAAQQRIAAINSSVEVTAQAQRLDDQTAQNLLAPCDVIVDCLDNLNSRFVMARAARKLGVPLVSAAIAGAAGHVTTIFPQDTGLESIFGPESAAPRQGAETSLGCLPQGVMLLASVESSEVIKIITRKGHLLQNQLLVIDLMDNTMERVTLG